MRNRVALGGTRVFDQSAGRGSCCRECDQAECREDMGIELAAQRTRRRFRLELPFGQASHGIGRTRRQSEIRGFRDQYFGRPQAFEFGGKIARLDFGGAKTPRGERQPCNADSVLLLP